MSVYVDTSALMALLNARDDCHAVARDEWTRLLTAEVPLLTSSVVAIEAHALVQSRMGLQAAAELHAHFLSLTEAVWVDEATYRRAVSNVLAAGRRDLGLVDCVSFLVMRDASITRAFTFDKHFAEEGFAVLPALIET